MTTDHVQTFTPSPVTPHLVCDGAAAAIDFYVAALGAVEQSRMPGPDGKLMHGCITINGGSVFLMDQNPDFGARGPGLLDGTPVSMHLVVPDADASFDRAVAAGATPVMPVETMFWGDRYGVIQDPYGHQWAFATPSATPPSPEEIVASVAAMGSPDAQPT